MNVFAVVGKNRLDPDRTGAFQVAPEEAPCIGRGLCIENADGRRSGRAVDGHEQIAAALIAHLRKICHVDREVPWLMDLEGFVFAPGSPALRSRE